MSTLQPHGLRHGARHNPDGDDPIPELGDSIETVLHDIGVIEHHWHSRWRVYPQDVTLTALLQAAAAANIFGDWALIIPLDTVPFDFEIVGLVVEQVSATTTYHVQLGHNPINAVPGANMEMGERRFRIAEVPIKRATELLTIHSQDIPANSTVWGRVKTASVVADTCKISVVLYRHIEVSREIPIYPAFPW